jgi:hypothetical protein
LRRASTEDPRKLKIEKQLKNRPRIQRERKKKKIENEASLARAAQSSIFDILDAKPEAVNAKANETDG